MKYLFVGGPHDGEWVETNSYPLFGLANKSTDDPRVVTMTAYQSHSFVDETSKRRWRVYAPAEWSSAEVFDHLVQNYKPRTVTP